LTDFVAEVAFQLAKTSRECEALAPDYQQHIPVEFDLDMKHISINGTFLCGPSKLGNGSNSPCSSGEVKHTGQRIGKAKLIWLTVLRGNVSHDN
jgi:hypothetical protein